MTFSHTEQHFLTLKSNFVPPKSLKQCVIVGLIRNVTMPSRGRFILTDNFLRIYCSKKNIDHFSQRMTFPF